MTPAQIKALRDARGWSGRQLADALGLGEFGDRKVRYFESGYRRPSGPELRLLEMLERGELPARYMPAPVRRGRPPRAEAAWHGIKVTEAGFGRRTETELAKAGIETLGQLATLTLPQLVRLPNFGLMSMRQVADKLRQYGIEIDPQDYLRRKGGDDGK